MSVALSAIPRKPAAVPFQPATYASTLIGTAMVSVTAVGELDAHNARSLAEYVETVLDGKRRLIVDLRGLTFFGTQGFSALHYVNVTCSRREVNWVVIAGVEVDRILRLCDPEGGLPVAGALESAIAAVSRPPRTHLKPIPR
jgi:anti-anti-sigma factor